MMKLFNEPDITEDQAYAIWKECGGYACDYYEYALKVIEQYKKNLETNQK